MDKIEIVAYNPHTNEERFKVFSSITELSKWCNSNRDWTWQPFTDWKTA